MYVLLNLLLHNFNEHDKNSMMSSRLDITFYVSWKSSQLLIPKTIIAVFILNINIFITGADIEVLIAKSLRCFRFDM